MLPTGGPNGFEVCRTLAQRPERTPIIILTAKGQQRDKVLGLELGADDYVTKPFALEEARPRSLSDRSPSISSRRSTIAPSSEPTASVSATDDSE